MKKKICFIAQFPPPIHGLSKAVDTLYNSDIRNEFDLERIDITNNNKFFSSLFNISRSKADLFYFTISQTKYGNFRDLIIFKLLELQGKKCLIHLHGGYYRQLIDNDLSKWQRKANYKAVGKLAGAIVLGSSLKYIFRGILPDEKILTVPNCVDDKYLMSDKEFEEKIRILAKCKVKHILYLSNFIKSKGYPEVLEMAKLEKERVEKGEDRYFHFDFAGKFFEKTEETFFWNYIRENELDDYITYHGIVNGVRKKELLKNSYAFILLTRYPKEGQPISILEAMGNGLIVVTTNYAGIPDIVTSHTGLIYDCNDKNIASKILDILSNTNLETMVITARKNILEQYDEKTYIENMKKIFLGGGHNLVIIWLYPCRKIVLQVAV